MNECAHPSCFETWTRRLAVWLDDDSRVTDYFVCVCDDHASMLIAAGNAASLPKEVN